MAQIRGMSHETAKKLQERERDKNSLLQKVASLESEVKSLSSERDTAVGPAPAPHESMWLPKDPNP